MILCNGYYPGLVLSFDASVVDDLVAKVIDKFTDIVSNVPIPTSTFTALSVSNSEFSVKPSSTWKHFRYSFSYYYDYDVKLNLYDTMIEISMDWTYKENGQTYSGKVEAEGLLEDFWVSGKSGF